MKEKEAEHETKAGLVTRTDITKYVYRIYLTDSVTGIADYSKILSVLAEAEKGDKIIINFQNFGGSCYTCVSIANAIKDSRAYVSANVLGPCFSAGTTLALACDSLRLHPHAFLHFHDYFAVFFGKPDSVKHELKQNDKWIHSYMREFHIPFLSEAEFKKVLAGKELYVHYSDRSLKKRLIRHSKKYE
jgi:ATP-dependent protease ClpP protease subunit